MKETEWGKTIGVRGGSNGMQYEQQADLAAMATPAVTDGPMYICTVQTKHNIEHTSVGLSHTCPIKCSVFIPGGGVVGAGQSVAEGRQKLSVKIPRLFW